MRVVSKKTIVACFIKHADAKDALEEWYTKAKKSEWASFDDVKQTFNSVDSIGNDRYVFNIKGNQYRLVGLILFNRKIIFIRFVGPHKEYDKIDCSKI